MKQRRISPQANSGKRGKQTKPVIELMEKGKGFQRKTSYLKGKCKGLQEEGFSDRMGRWDRQEP